MKREKPVDVPPLQIRLDAAQIALVDAVTALASKVAGTPVRRSSVLQTALTRGLEAMREELQRKK